MRYIKERPIRRYIISQHKAFKILEWILFIAFSIVAGWFASGVLEQFFSHKTNFSQHEEKDTVYPVVVIHFYHRHTSEVNLTNVKIIYIVSGMKKYGTLENGRNYFHNDEYNKTEKVILESLENKKGERAFRIIHATPILKGSRLSVRIKMYTKLEKMKNDSNSDLVSFYLTSPENSPGYYGYTWEDGNPLQISMHKNTCVKYNIQTQMTKYLKHAGECQKEPYYKCIASQIDAIEFNECSNKCMPNVFANMDKNYSIAFCCNDTHSQQCILIPMLKEDDGSNCKKSCSNKEYLGEVYLNVPITSDVKDQDLYYFMYRLNNHNFASKVYEEYLIYDAIGMVGSVGGTLGMSSIEF